jgi:predicted ArsR family transcriptional regulator
MLAPLLGSAVREKVLLFLFARRKGYSREIARFFDTDLNQVQKQLDHLEAGGVLVSQTAGRTRLYEFSPRYAFRAELDAMLEKALRFLPESQQERLTLNRRRPRRRAKPL